MSSSQNTQGQPQHSSEKTTSTPVQKPCPYHAEVLSMKTKTEPKDLTPMQRFLGEGPTEQSAMFTRPDNGKLSTSKDCTCEVASSEG
ncbi:unnamed protein product [Periconia digitata]|uniref:Uncharacterized protein n=1 Tax=Periconia digitata TaxID=1303443 RepID=A0A9W4XNL4_9PLEO|nr:unnamed protein product [Periconia digitata]